MSDPAENPTIQAAVVALVRAVLHAEAKTLPPAVREARAKLAEKTKGEVPK